MSQVISKSARTSAEGVIVKIDLAPNLEEDTEAVSVKKNAKNKSGSQDR